MYNNGKSKDFLHCLNQCCRIKNIGSEVNISLAEYGTVLNKNEMVDVFNRHFLSAAKGVGTADEINGGFALTYIAESHADQLYQVKFGCTRKWV